MSFVSVNYVMFINISKESVLVFDLDNQIHTVVNNSDDQYNVSALDMRVIELEVNYHSII